jgi:iron-sulfur cluster insertion protein
MESTSHAAHPDTSGSPQPVIFTEAAIAKIRQFLETKEEAQGKSLRVFVQGGGCSGFEYGFTFDVEKDGDVRIPQGEIEVLVDMFSLPYLEGSQVDYTESLMGSGFTVTNPNAKGTCGCGHSFTT